MLHPDKSNACCSARHEDAIAHYHVHLAFDPIETNYFRFRSRSIRDLHYWLWGTLSWTIAGGRIHQDEEKATRSKRLPVYYSQWKKNKISIHQMLFLLNVFAGEWEVLSRPAEIRVRQLVTSRPFDLLGEPSWRDRSSGWPFQAYHQAQIKHASLRRDAGSKDSHYSSVECAAYVFFPSWGTIS